MPLGSAHETSSKLARHCVWRSRVHMAKEKVESRLKTCGGLLHAFPFLLKPTHVNGHLNMNRSTSINHQTPGRIFKSSAQKCVQEPEVSNFVHRFRSTDVEASATKRSFEARTGRCLPRLDFKSRGLNASNAVDTARRRMEEALTRGFRSGVESKVLSN